MDFSLLMELRHHLTIKHHVPGRIRVSFTLKLLNDPRAQELKNNARTTPPPCIHDVQLNLFARSIIVEYDQDIIIPEKLHEALTTTDQGRFEELAAEFESIMTAYS